MDGLQDKSEGEDPEQMAVMLRAIPGGEEEAQCRPLCTIAADACLQLENTGHSSPVSWQSFFLFDPYMPQFQIISLLLMSPSPPGCAVQGGRGRSGLEIVRHVPAAHAPAHPEVPNRRRA